MRIAVRLPLLQRLLQQLEGVVLRVGKAMAVRTCTSLEHVNMAAVDGLEGLLHASLERLRVQVVVSKRRWPPLIRRRILPRPQKVLRAVECGVERKGGSATRGGTARARPGGGRDRRSTASNLVLDKTSPKLEARRCMVMHRQI